MTARGCVNFLFKVRHDASHLGIAPVYPLMDSEEGKPTLFIKFTAEEVQKPQNYHCGLILSTKM